MGLGVSGLYKNTLYLALISLSQIIPTETLEWTRCYEAPFECARLEVCREQALKAQGS